MYYWLLSITKKLSPLSANSAIKSAGVMRCAYSALPFRINSHFFLNALKNTSGQTSFRYATNDYAIDLLRERLRILGKEDALPIEIDFLAKYYMRSISEMIQDWFIGGQKIPLDNFIELLVLAMPEPLKKRLL